MLESHDYAYMKQTDNMSNSGGSTADMIKVKRPKSASVSGFEGPDHYSHTGYSTPVSRKSEIDVEYTSNIDESDIDAEEYPGMESFLRKTVTE